MLSRERPRPDANSDDTSFWIQRASCSRYVFGCRSGTHCLIANTRAVLRELYVFPVSMTISITSMSFSRHTRIPGLGDGLHPLTALCLCSWKKTLVPLWVTEKMNRDLRDLVIDTLFSCLSRAIVYRSTLDTTIRPVPVYILQILEKMLLILLFIHTPLPTQFLRKRMPLDMFPCMQSSVLPYIA